MTGILGLAGAAVGAIQSIFGIRSSADKARDGAVTDWFVSLSGSIFGSGLNSGDPIPPTELSRRLRGVTITVAGFQTINYDAAGDPTGTFIITWNVPPGCQVVFTGVPTAVPGFTGTLTSWVAISTASPGNSYGFTDSALATAGAWHAQVGNRIRLPSTGQVFFIVKDENDNVIPVPKTARVAPPYLATFTYPFNNTTKFVHTIPTTTTAYVVESVPSLGSVQRLGSIAPNSSVNGVNIGIIFKDINVVDCAIDPPTGCAVAYLSCSLGLLHPVDSGQFFVLGSLCKGIDSNGGKIFATGSAFGAAGFAVSLNPGANMWIQDCMIQGVAFGVAVGATSRLLSSGADGLQFFDVPAFAMNVTGTFLVQQTISGDNCISATQIADGGKMLITVLPTLVAGSGLGGFTLLVDNVSYTTYGNGVTVDKRTGSGMFWNVLGSGGNATPTAFWACSALAVLTATNQCLPPGYSATALLASSETIPLVFSQPGNLSAFTFSHVGDAANVAGQTVTYQLRLNGNNVTGAVVSIAANSSTPVSTNFIVNTNPTWQQQVVPGDKLTVFATPSATLTVGVKDMAGSVS